MISAAKKSVLAVAVVLLAGAAQEVRAGVTIILGQDASYHWPSQAGALQLGFNATSVAGGSSNPNILAISDGSFGENLPGLLAADGFTHVTSINPGQLSTTDLSGFNVIYFGPGFGDQGSVDIYNANAARILAFSAAGGGLVLEPEILVTGAYNFAPGGSLITPTQNGGNDVNVVDPGNPVMAGLTTASLSNWGASYHDTFLTPGAGGYTVLATNNAGEAVDIIRSDTLATPEPSTIALGCAALPVGLILAWRRRKAKLAA